MRTLWVLVFGIVVALPAWADEIEEPAVPTDATEIMEEPPPAEEPPPPVEEVAEAPVEEEPEAEREPWHFYLGAMYADSIFSVSQSPTFPSNRDFDTSHAYLQIGTVLFDAIGFELQFGAGVGDEDTGNDAAVEQYVGLFVVPTATLFEFLEMAFPIGFAAITMQHGGLEADYDSMSYGANLQFPFRALGEGVPNLRLIAGGQVFHQDREARIYGWQAGLRFDFEI